MRKQFEELLNKAVGEAFAAKIEATHHKLAAMPKAGREAYMEANGMYHGPDYDPTFYDDPAQWWRDFRAGKKPNAIDAYENPDAFARRAVRFAGD